MSWPCKMCGKGVQSKIQLCCGVAEKEKEITRFMCMAELLANLISTYACTPRPANDDPQKTKIP